LGSNVGCGLVSEVVLIDERAALVRQTVEAAAESREFVVVLRRRVALLSETTNVVGESAENVGHLAGAVTPQAKGDIAGHGRQQGANVVREIPFACTSEEFHEYLLNNVIGQTRQWGVAQCQPPDKPGVSDERLSGPGNVGFHPAVPDR